MQPYFSKAYIFIWINRSDRRQRPVKPLIMHYKLLANAKTTFARPEFEKQTPF